MRIRNLRLLAAAALVTCGCGSQPSPPPPQATPAATKRVDAATAGNVTGRVTYDGPALPNPSIKLDSDPACAREHPNGMALEAVLVNNGGLDNVFVYVKDGLSDYAFDTPTEPVRLDQKGCRYTPHVFGLRAGQPLLITNGDQTLHTVHAMGQANQEFNLSQPLQGISHTKTFTAPEVTVHFKCNVHTWMEAYAGVVSHPYFAVTANGGGFELKGLPPGTYTVAAWHEKLGAQEQRVTLGEKESKAVNFAFKATTP